MSDSVNRRTFLGQTMAASAAGIAAPAILSAANKAPSKKVTIGIMGMQRGLALAKTFGALDGVEIKYVCDTDETRLAKAAKTVEKATKKAPQAIGDFRKILDDKDVDALIVAPPNHWHSPATILGCSAGKNVYVEKPCSHNPKEGEMMVAAARKNKRAVQMGSQRRSSESIMEGIQKVKEGVIGNVYLARAYYQSARGSIGTGKPASAPAELNYDLWQGPAPRQKYADNLIHYNWHWFWKYGNGELGNNGVHSLDLCRWGLDVDYPTRVVSSGGRYAFDDDQQTPDTHVVAYEFDGNKQITWQGTSCNRHKNDFVTFFGSKGNLIIGTSGGYRILDAKDKEIEKVDGNQGMSEHAQNFIDAIRNDEPLNLNAEIEIGHKSTLLCHIGNIAHRTGRTMTCDPTNGHIQNDQAAMALWTREYEPGWEPKV
ncbi:Gfo/Idh/MocA family oxidoreductase [uncultured Gimesia sp.]|uniref:Gfo/Idh/MocA family protein n=1 Tax=uncultured Gimesia sp. TaxID=1678688 RepID=UPI0030DCE1EB